MSWRKPRLPGLRRDEEVLVEVRGTVRDSSGTSLPGTGTSVTVGVTQERIVVWSVPTGLLRTGRMLGSVSRSRVESVVADRRDARTAVSITFEEDAHLTIDAPAEVHPEQLAWILTADPPNDEH